MNNWLTFVQNLAFPPRCLLCGQPENPSGICLGCREDLPWNPNPCGRCALPLPLGAPTGTLCPDCQKSLPEFDLILTPLIYRPPVDQLILRLKNAGQLQVARLLAELIADKIQPSLADRPQILLPAPISDQRIRARGFNQSAELCLHLSKLLDIPWSPNLLQKTWDTPHQTGLGRRQRARNLRGSFALSGQLAGQHVGIVDDVVTTSATAAGIARTLKHDGVARVTLLAVARTPKGHQSS